MTQSGVVYASTTERPVGTSRKPQAASSPKPTMWSRVMLSSTGRSARGGAASRPRAIATANSTAVAMAERRAISQRGGRLSRRSLFTGHVRPQARTTATRKIMG